MNFSDWKEVIISDTILSSNTGLDAIKRAPIVDYDSGIKCLRIQDISQDKSFKDWGFCAVEDKNYSKFQLKKSDIIVARTGATIGVNKLIRNDLKSVYNNGLIRIKVNSDIIDYRYLYYNMQGDNYRGHIQAISGGTSTQPNMKMNALLDFKINLPPLPEQKAIADTLSCLDDKIELNNRINKTLEETAQAIFKSWFVDFEFPNEQDQTYKSSRGEFIDSELGKIPKGWKVIPLDQIADFINGLPLQNYRPKGSEFLPVIKIKELKEGINSVSEKADINLDNKFIVKDGDIIFSWSGSLDVKIWCGGRGALNQHLFKVESSKYPKWLIYLWLIKHLNEFRRIASEKVTTMGHIQRKHLSDAKTIIPPNQIINSFNKIFEPIFNKYILNNIENKSLGEIRDTLLPKLITGKIRVNLEDLKES